MMKISAPQIVTANDLLDGDVVYLTRDGQWARHLPNAAIFTSEPAAERMLDFASDQSDRVVDPYLTGVQVTPNGQVEPLHFREIFRTRGPSNRLDHGKQAEFDHVPL